LSECVPHVIGQVVVDRAREGSGLGLCVCLHHTTVDRTLTFSVIRRSIIILIRILLNHLTRSSSIGLFISNAQYQDDTSILYKYRNILIVG